MDGEKHNPTPKPDDEPTSGEADSAFGARPVAGVTLTG
jgi:hypothetical protein